MANCKNCFYESMVYFPCKTCGEGYMYWRQKENKIPTPEELIESEIGIGRNANQYTPMDKGECVVLMKKYAELTAIAFFDDIRNYEREKGNDMRLDERSSEEFYMIFKENFGG